MTQIAADPADALQAGVYALLSGDATLVGLVSGVFDHVPEGTALPYVVVGEMISTEDSAHGSHGRMTTATLHTWTRARSHRPGNQIAARVAALLVRRQAELGPLVAGHAVWRVQHEFAQTLVDPEPETRHRVDRFRVWTRQEEV